MIKGINEPRKNLKVTLSKEADSALERTFPGFKQAIPVHFTDLRAMTMSCEFLGKEEKRTF